MQRGPTRNHPCLDTGYSRRTRHDYPEPAQQQAPPREPPAHRRSRTRAAMLPSAPLRRVTLYGGLQRAAWYDILGLGPTGPREDEAQLAQMALAVESLVEREHARGVTHERIVLAGFSQGGAMALHAGLRSERALGAILVLSGYLPLAQSFVAQAPPARPNVPILFCHGRHDGVVPPAGGRLSYELVKSAGFDANWAEFDVAHSMNLEEVRFISEWLRPRFGGE